MLQLLLFQMGTPILSEVMEVYSVLRDVRFHRQHLACPMVVVV